MNVSPHAHIRMDNRDGIVLLRLDRPPANALDNATLVGLRECIREAGGGAGVVLTGNPRFFSAGGDMKELSTLNVESLLERVAEFHALLGAIRALDVPFACAVSGYAVGGGTEIAMFADRVVADRTAVFGLPEINHGLLPSTASVGRAVELLGLVGARRLLFSGEFVGVGAAAELGLVDEVVVDHEAAVGAATAWVRAMAEKPPLLFARLKESLNAFVGASFSDAEEHTVAAARDYFLDPASGRSRAALIARWQEQRRS